MRGLPVALGVALALAACGGREPPDPAGLSPEDAALLNNAAEMLDVNATGATAPEGNAG